MSFFNILSLGEQLFPSKVSSLSLRKWFFKRISCSLISLAQFQDDKNLNFIFKFWKSHKFPNILNHLYHSLKTFFPVFYNCQKFSLIICNEYFNKVFLVKTTGTKRVFWNECCGWNEFCLFSIFFFEFYCICVETSNVFASNLLSRLLITSTLGICPFPDIAEECLLETFFKSTDNRKNLGS